MKMKIATTIILMIIILNYILINISLGQIMAPQVLLYSKGNCSGILQYSGEDLTIEHVVYEYEGIEYPAYSLSYLEEGINANSTYVVNVEQCARLGAWETLYWGYPYKTPEELGCMGATEAYVATELALACILGNKDLNELNAVNEEGQRILKAVHQIVNIVITTETSKPVFNIYAVADNTDWIIDTFNPAYISKTYSMIGNDCEYERITPRLFGDVPLGTIVTDTNNQEKQTFSKNEQFKILIPINTLDRNSNFILDILIEGKAYTVLQGTPIDNTQRVYMLSTDKLENLVYTIVEGYTAQNSINMPETETNENSDIECAKTDNATEDTPTVNKYIEIEYNIEKNNKTQIENIKNITTNNIENKEVSNVITNVINSEMIDVSSIMEYINEINKQNKDLQARIVEQEKTIENITKENNVIQQKEITEIKNAKKLPRTGY